MVFFISLVLAGRATSLLESGQYLTSKTDVFSPRVSSLNRATSMFVGVCDSWISYAVLAFLTFIMSLFLYTCFCLCFLDPGFYLGGGLFPAINGEISDSNVILTNRGTYNTGFLLSIYYARNYTCRGHSPTATEQSGFSLSVVRIHKCGKLR